MVLDFDNSAIQPGNRKIVLKSHGNYFVAGDKSHFIAVSQCPILFQCSKLRVHSVPGVHISAAGRTFFGRVP